MKQGQSHVSRNGLQVNIPHKLQVIQSTGNREATILYLGPLYQQEFLFCTRKKTIMTVRHYFIANSFHLQSIPVSDKL